MVQKFKQYKYYQKESDGNKSKEGGKGVKIEYVNVLKYRKK